MAKAIKFEDIRPDDKIRILDVTEVTVDRIGGEIMVTKDKLMRYKDAGMSSTKRTFELVERPVSLPTEPGSVIRTEGKYGNRRTWMLKSNGMWVKQNDFSVTSKGLQALIADADLKFEVLG